MGDAAYRGANDVFAFRCGPIAPVCKQGYVVVPLGAFSNKQTEISKLSKQTNRNLKATKRVKLMKSFKLNACSKQNDQSYIF